MNCVIYCRVSSKEQVDGTSLEIQEAACRDYAREKTIEVLRVFVEQGESAKFADRTRLIELLDFCRSKTNAVNVLLVWKVDRFARNVADHFSVKATLAKYGVQIVSVTEPIDAKPEGKLMETILAGFAQFDNDIRAMRTVQGMRRKIQEGIFPWKPPFGYKSAPRNTEKKTLPDIPDEKVFSVLQRAWQEYGTGAYTRVEIGRLMQSWGLSTARGRSFSPQFLFQFFVNPYYAGILVDPWDKREYVGKHVPVVSRVEFYRVQAVIGKRSNSTPHHAERAEFPLRGVVRCESCKHYLTASISRGRNSRYPYYHCQTRGCLRYGKSSRAPSIHTEFGDFLNRLTPKEGMLEQLRQHILAAASLRQAKFKNQSELRRERLVRLDNELDGLIRMRAQDLITDKEFLRQKTIVLEQYDVLETGSSWNPNLHEIRDRLDEITLPLQQLRKTWESLSPRFRTRFHRLVLPVGFVQGHIGTAETGLIFNALSEITQPDSTEVPLAYHSWNPIIQEIQWLSEIFRGEEESKKELPIAV